MTAQLEWISSGTTQNKSLIALLALSVVLLLAVLSFILYCFCGQGCVTNICKRRVPREQFESNDSSELVETTVAQDHFIRTRRATKDFIKRNLRKKFASTTSVTSETPLSRYTPRKYISSSRTYSSWLPEEKHHGRTGMESIVSSSVNPATFRSETEVDLEALLFSSSPREQQSDMYSSESNGSSEARAQAPRSFTQALRHFRTRTRTIETEHCSVPPLKQKTHSTSKLPLRSTQVSCIPPYGVRPSEQFDQRSELEESDDAVTLFLSQSIPVVEIGQHSDSTSHAGASLEEFLDLSDVGSDC